LRMSRMPNAATGSDDALSARPIVARSAARNSVQPRPKTVEFIGAFLGARFGLLGRRGLFGDEGFERVAGDAGCGVNDRTWAVSADDQRQRTAR
jgi:hypothetical protein